MRIGTCILFVLLIASATLLGCTAGTRPWNPPTKDHPITMDIFNELEGLMFGGEDGTARVFVPHTDAIGPMAVSPSARLAAICTPKGHGGETLLTFYGPSKEVIATVDLGKAGAGRYGSMWVSDRGEAVLVGAHKDHYRPRQFGPSGESGPCVEALYVNRAGAVQRFGLSSPVRQVLFTDTPGFAVLQWANAGHGGGPNSWLLSRFKSPSDLAWEVMIVTKGYAYLPGSRVSRHMLMANESPIPTRADLDLKPGFDVSVILPGGYLHFRPDASYVFERYVPRPLILPDYKERTGNFYEEAFLIKAMDQLARTASLTAFERATAVTVLRDFIYDYLDVYVKDAGEIPPEDHKACLERLDKAMAAHISGSKFQKFLEWRNAEADSANPMGFLFRPPPVVKPEDLFWVTVITPPANR